MEESSRYASRKFVLCLLVIVAAFVLTFIKVFDPSTAAEVIKAALYAYCAANVVQKSAEKIVARFTEKDA